MKRIDESGSEPFWTWTVRPDGVVVLTMPSWAMFNSRWNWRPWLEERLDSLRGQRGLIMDLRDNEGGNDCGDEILARLTASPIAQPGVEHLVRFQHTPADLDPFLDTWDNGFRTLGVGTIPLADGFYRLTGERIDIRTAALIGPVNSSATFNFAEKARASGLVRLFGETTGGNRRGINGGCFFFVRLPASGIEFDLPLIGYFPPGHPPDAGLAPDVTVELTAADLTRSYDRQLETAARWILG
jgi:C-terminal processing protease CtpA/Prc